MDKKDLKLALATLCAKDIPLALDTQPHVLSINPTSAYSYKSVQDSIDVFQDRKQGYVYSRYANPTVVAVEHKLAALEAHGTDLEPGCLMTNSGLSAISTLSMALLSQGDSILTQNDLYGGTTELFIKVIKRNGIKVHFADLNDTVAVEALIKKEPSIKLIYLETPTNPTLRCIDIAGLTTVARRNGIQTAIDNTFSTFYLQQPLALGVDFVVYSTTKFLNGHGNSIAGAIITRESKDRKKIWEVMKLIGTNTNPWDAWLLHNGLKTLVLRMDKHSSNALHIAKSLEQHSVISKVNYPGLSSHTTHKQARKQMSQYGGMLSFEVNGGLEKAIKFMDNTKLCTIAATLGNVDTLLLHPASSSHLNVDPEIRKASGISDGLIRMSVGIEDPEDLLIDIIQALL